MTGPAIEEVFQSLAGVQASACSGGTLKRELQRIQPLRAAAYISATGSAGTIAAGDYHSLALKSNGTVVAWGDRVVNIGATNVPANLSNVIAIAAGASFSAALKSDGTVTVFGSGPPTNGMTNVVAIAGNEFPLLALKADRTVVGGPTSLSNVVAVAPARYDYFALRADGTVVNWASGNPVAFTWPTNVVVLASGQNHRLAILGDGQPPPPVVDCTNVM